MDKNIISVITDNLSQKDLIRFALVNNQTYHYCKHTNVKKKKCEDKHNTYHFTLSLFENAKLSYSMNILSSVQSLYNNEISLHSYNIQILLTQPCGTKTKIILGRDIIINSIVYSYDNLTSLCDLQKDTKIDLQNSKIYNINKNIERLQHKINSILSHKYVKLRKKVTNNLIRDCHQNIVQHFEKCIDLYFIRLLYIN